MLMTGGCELLQDKEAALKKQEVGSHLAGG